MHTKDTQTTPQQSSRWGNTGTRRLLSNQLNAPSIIFKSMTSSKPEAWITAIPTLVLLLSSLFVSSYCVGPTAITTTVNLWGIPDTHNIRPEITYNFFGTPEYLQLGFFLLALAACVFSLLKGKYTFLMTLAFSMTVALTTAQSFRCNADEWIRMDCHNGRIYLFWAGALLLYAPIRGLISLRQKNTTADNHHRAAPFVLGLAIIAAQIHTLRPYAVDDGLLSIFFGLSPIELTAGAILLACTLSILTRFRPQWRPWLALALTPWPCIALIICALLLMIFKGETKTDIFNIAPLVAEGGIWSFASLAIAAALFEIISQSIQHLTSPSNKRTAQPQP